MRLSDEQKKRLAIHGKRVERRNLEGIADIVVTDKILSWYRNLIPKKWTFSRQAIGRPRTSHENLAPARIIAWRTKFAVSE